MGLGGGTDVKYSSYTKYPEKLVLITNFFLQPQTDGGSSA